MSNRLIYLLGVVGACGILAAGFYFQIMDGINPCPLCILQRFCFGLIGFFFLLGFLLNTCRFVKIVSCLFTSVFGITGILLAGRQIWLQHTNVNGTECGVSLQYMLKVLPLNEVMQKVFTGSAECTQRGWEFLTLNMPEWAIICFIGFTLMAIYLLMKALQQRS